MNGYGDMGEGFTYLIKILIIGAIIFGAICFGLGVWLF